ESNIEQINLAVEAAHSAFPSYRKLLGAERSAFLEKIALEIENLGDDLLRICSGETALPIARLAAEGRRTINQIRMFAELVKNGAWRDARIDRAINDRKPLPRPDLRRILVPIGPCGVWAASNFPLAFSVAGGDSISALAAGNPIVVKAHPAHPVTSDMVARAIIRAIRACRLSDGVFSMIQGRTPKTSLALVQHALLRAAAFTGSFKAGRALYNAATERETPIPLFAEMGSVNPVFVLPEALEQRSEAIAQGLTNSVNMDVGQFCTSPGLIVGLESKSLDRFSDQMRTCFAQVPPGRMLYSGIRASFEVAVERLRRIPEMQTTSGVPAPPDGCEATPALFESTAEVALARDELFDEVFGPSSILIRCRSTVEMENIARRVQGSLTATLHGTTEDFKAHRNLVFILETRVGRMILNGYPTGVEVCASMQHGGPYPATTDSRFTSVGTAAIQRFARPLCYQDFPQDMLPAELLDENPLRILRTVDGVFSREAL
ncbi:MAG TPA: aldehyde dehydrogenase (NADP(+)), partial [Terriglobales bacterium]|nr:aldehyde dehydrogenase (NADP(+)) [Terriglobales bacterium]